MKFYFSYFTVIDLREKKGRELLISNDRKKTIFINIDFNHKIIIDFNAI
jgi:sporulation protein YlmC with PRC-barrel domain